MVSVCGRVCCMCCMCVYHPLTGLCILMMGGLVGGFRCECARAVSVGVGGCCLCVCVVCVCVCVDPGSVLQGLITIDGISTSIRVRVNP